jgi:hypothetical protein
VKPWYALELDPGFYSRQVQPDNSTTASLPIDIKEQLDKMKLASERLRSVHYDILGGIEQLRGAVKTMSLRVIDIDSQG